MKIGKDETIDVLSYKPKMRSLETVEDLTVDSETVVMAKADGEFNLLIYDREGESYTVNRWARKLSNFPALNEFVLAFSKTDGIKTAQLLVEMYAMEHGKPLMLPKYIHFLKGHDTNNLKKIFIGIFDILKINNIKITEPYGWKLEEADSWVSECRWVHVLPWKRTTTLAEVNGLWRDFVQNMGYEGLVVRNTRGIFKIKPLLEMDAVIIGINKRELLKKKQVTSLRLGLLKEDMTIVEVGDVASGITVPLRKALWKLMKYKVAEDKDSIFLKPMVVCKLKFNDIYRETTNKVFKFGASFEEIGKQKLIKLRHPKLAGFRSDKKLCLEDVGLNQIPDVVRGRGS